MLLGVEDTPQPLNTEHVYTTGNPTKRQVPKSLITEVSVGLLSKDRNWVLYWTNVYWSEVDEMR